MKPFFAVIIPSFNRADTLGEALQSVAEQSFTDFECWVIDDASTDRTPQVIEPYLKDPRFHSFRNPQNRRQHYSRNRAIERSTAPWITFLDSDDLWLPRRLEYFHQSIQRRPEVGFWFSNGLWIRAGKTVGRFFEPDRKIPEGRVPGYYAVGNRHIPYVTTNVAVARSVFEGLGLFREDMQILEDTEFYARALAGGTQVGVIREELSHYRLHAKQITQDHLQNFRESMIALDSAGTPSDIKMEYRRDLIRDTVIFLLKSGRPWVAREFLKEQNAAASLKGWWLLTWIPAPVLLLLRRLRRAA